MHYLHGILVNISDFADEQNLEVLARQRAMSETEQYHGQVFDWRTEEDAGRYSEYHPGFGVTLGVKEPKKFLEEFNNFVDSPLREAIATSEWLKHENHSWRTEAQIKTIDGCEKILENDEIREVNGVFWSGVKTPTVFSFDKESLERIWENEERYSMQLYRIKKIVQLIDGDYISDSYFYDAEWGGSKIPKDRVEKIRENPSKYAIVYVDIHN